MNTTKAVGYIRVSTIGQAEDGVSLEAQKAKIAAWCEVNDCALVSTFADEGISGHTMNRPGLQAAVETACRQGGVLVVYSLSRLARNTRETLELGERLDKAGADLVSLSEKIDTTSAAGKMVFRMLAVLAEFERDQVSERTTMALAHKKALGHKTGGDVPYGYRLAEDGKTLVSDEAEQALLQAIREARGRGLSQRAVVAELTRQGFTTRKGTEFSLDQVQKIMKREQIA